MKTENTNKMLSMACKYYDEHGDLSVEALTDKGQTIVIKIEHCDFINEGME